MDRLEYFARLVAEDPAVARARFGYANELLRAERWEEAVVELRAYLGLAEDAYLTGIDQSLKHGHTGMADEFQAALEAL
jgi:hypothetical protein